MSLSVQLFSLLAMIGTGIVAAALIDAIGTGVAYGEKGSLVRKYATIIEVIGWIFVGCWAFLILYIVRDGAWRIYDPLAQFSGLLLYVSFFHRPFRFVGRIFLLLLIKPIWFVLTVIYSMVKSVLNVIGRLLKLSFNPFVLIFRKLTKKPFKNKMK